MMKRISTLIATLALLLTAAPMAAQAEEGADGAALMNETCPFTDKETAADKFVKYSDDEAGVHARIYFCCGKCQGKAADMDQAALKPRYIKAYLADSDAEYGEAALVVNNDSCPVSGNAADGSVTMNYNGAQLNLCCPDCEAAVVADPGKHLANISDAIDAAQSEQDEEGESAG